MAQHTLDTIKKMEEQFVDRIAENMRTYGVSTTVGRVLGIIYMNRKPMTLEALSDETGMSKTRMSQVVREMLSLNVAHKVFEKGVRKDLYDVEKDYYQTFISIFVANWQAVIAKNRAVGKRIQNEVKRFMEAEADNLSADEMEQLNHLLKETEQWLHYYKWLDDLVDFFESGDVFHHVPKPD
ncbi:transcriptional regulator [Niallia circulans]|uniref:GbsR/MarR family transcriptional regulator n=1 Tax=Shouchella clausii TaxID=79880 RepID=UPI000BA7CFA1|nr:GbsR/MarR family transcriptional regulator [Shouchella clausii]MCY1106415.1 GbsR/MarR family transcriptional regulator [Shouchella clausii]PAF12253.1 MarR family transcriptional regulator [Shouchella clausii]SPU21866.1 transcriptional regulator [Niallia circulans]